MKPHPRKYKLNTSGSNTPTLLCNVLQQRNRSN